jgi:protein SCO1/2
MRQSTCRLLLLAGLGITGCGPAQPALTPADIAPLGQVADFKLSDQNGAEFGAAQMAGKVWIVDFFFTSCPSFCPLLTGAMSNLAREFREEAGLNFLSITVDPGTDTPAVLRAFAEREKLPQQRWRLLSGKIEDIVRLCEGSFKLAFGEADGTTGDITHSSRLVLVDANGQIRGYFDALDAAEQTKLRAAIRAVLAESPAN